MNPIEHDASMAKLTAEMAWMRRLARALLRDDAAADVPQDAWLAAAERRPADVQLRPWLSRVVASLDREYVGALWRPARWREPATGEVRRPDEPRTVRVGANLGVLRAPPPQLSYAREDRVR